MCDDPICGNCGNPKSKHYFEHEIFCFTHTTGDIFTDEPSEQLIIEMMMDKHPTLYEECVKEWKRDNGHT